MTTEKGKQIEEYLEIPYKMDLPINKIRTNVDKYDFTTAA